MAQITIDIPDELASQLTPYQSQFSELFTQLIAAPLLTDQNPTKNPQNGEHSASLNVYQEVLDFLISRPTSEQIINFKVSTSSQQKLQTLLQKSKETALTATERTELDLHEQLDTLVGLLKVRAYSTDHSKTNTSQP